ncbi:YbaN family protein [Dongia sp. agr-C8]
MKRPAFFAAGSLLVVVGFVGAFLPLLPTTPFLILAAACFARSSPRVEAWLLNHRRFGPVLRAWREHGAIPVKAKLFACAGMSLGYTVFWWSHQPGLPLAAAVAAAMIGIAAYVLSRPSAA